MGCFFVVVVVTVVVVVVAFVVVFVVVIVINVGEDTSTSPRKLKFGMQAKFHNYNDVWVFWTA